MQDAESLVHQALDSDETLIGLLGGKNLDLGWQRVYNSNKVQFADEFPRITLFEVVNTDECSADNRALMSDVNVRVDIWTKNETTLFSIINRVKTVLTQNLLCNVKLGAKLTETDSEETIYHKVVEVYLLLEQEEE